VTTFLLVRHGETDWNREQRWQGHADQPLNDLGREQARGLARTLAGEALDAVYSSDLLRARETAGILAEPLGLRVRLDPRLREVDVGGWSGLTHGEIELRYPDGHRRRLDGGTGWEDGETYGAMGARVLEALRAIADEHPDGRILVVTHGGPMREVWLATGGTFEERPRIDNCTLHEVVLEHGAVRRPG
jgi:probable phosphoglycerate mutase